MQEEFSIFSQEIENFFVEFHWVNVKKPQSDSILLVNTRESKNQNVCHAECYIHEDVPNVIVLQGLYVSPEFRRNGIGLKLQLARENFGRAIGCSLSMLYVEKDSWMEKWYAKRGYEFSSHKENNYIWMQKDLL
jgi:GNAT superfamily N-acetyltransferase